MNFLNTGNFGTLADGKSGDPGMIGNLQLGVFDGRQEDGMGGLPIADGEQVECIDMEVVIGDQKFIITVYPDSDPHALATEFAAQQNLEPEAVEQLTEQIQDSIEANFEAAGGIDQ